MRSDFMTVSMIGSDGSSMTWIDAVGRPRLLRRRALSSRAASAQQALAQGCGQMTIALRVRSARIAL